MRLKTFIAKDMQEALASVRAELGPEAIIVSRQRTKNGGMMVRAAIDDAAEDASAEDAAATLAEPRATPEPQPINFEDAHRASIARRLRGEAPEKKNVSRNFNRAELLAILHAHRAPETISHAMAQAAEKCGLPDMTLALAAAFDTRMKSAPLDFAKLKGILLAGVNGAGKTAVAAKIAAHARLVARDVTLIAADAEGAGAVARLETFADHLSAKIVVADTAEALAKAFAEAITKNHVAIADTAGFDPRNPKARTAFAALATIEGIETIGIASATSDAEDTGETVAALKSAGATRLIVTCLDMTRRYGALASAAAQGIALAHITRSPFIAGGLETLTPLSLSRLLIEARNNPDRAGTQ
jgi:flagellar biosynthesis protein FlhF